MPDIRRPSAPLGPAFRGAADSETARAALGHYLREGKGIQAARIIKVWPRPDGVFVFLYEITDDKGAAWATAFLFPAGHERTRRPCAARAAYVPEWNAYVQLFPNDYRMPHLRSAASAGRAREVLASTLTSAGSKWKGFVLRSAEPLSYWPSRKCLLKYRGRTRGKAARFYSKVFFDDTAPRLLNLHEALRACGFDGRNGFQVPVPIGHSPEFKAALFAPAPGRTVFDLLDSPEAEPAAAEAARALAGLHTSPKYAQVPVQGPEEEIGALQGWVRAVESVGIQDMSEPRNLLSRLEENRAVADSPFLPCHGDFYDKQLLFDGRIMTVLDLDMACLAPRERDAGNFLAHLELRGLENTGEAGRYDRLGLPFAEAYERCGGRLSARALHWHRAAAFLRLACRAAIQPSESRLVAPLICLVRREIELF